MSFRPSVDEVAAAFVRYDVPEELARKAAQRQADEGLVVVSVSGKLAAGKDTTAPMALAALGASESEHQYFAFPLKSEVNGVIELIRNYHATVPYYRLSTAVSVLFNTAPDDAVQVVGHLLPEFKEGNPPKDGWDKTPGNRRALQHWGTEIRRHQDENYFVKKTLGFVAELLATGKSVQITDARFPNEADALRAVGAVLVRLDISPETQAARLAGRDGVTITEEMKNHPSETALDDYEGFHLRLNTDALDLDETRVALRAGLAHLRPASA